MQSDPPSPACPFHDLTPTSRTDAGSTEVSTSPSAPMAPGPPTGTRFADIQALLNQLTAGHSASDMQAAHNAPGLGFGWESLEQFRSIVVWPNGPGQDSYPLIDMNLVNAGKGDQTNLVIALRPGSGVNGYGRMPQVPPGRRVTDAELQTIIDWLNAGMPE